MLGHYDSCRIHASAIDFELLEILMITSGFKWILPIISIFIMVVTNKSGLLGDYKNSVALNIARWVVTAVVTFLGLYSLVDAITSFFA